MNLLNAGGWHVASNTNLSSTVAPLALRSKAAAEAVGIGQRKLWELTHPRGPIRCVRLGTAVLYPTDELRRFLCDAMAKESHHE
jgi:hypothetical protein